MSAPPRHVSDTARFLICVLVALALLGVLQLVIHA
jgi:hypothetical protein